MLSSVLPFIVTGIVTGAVYGLAGAGLVLTFKTSGLFNFAHGSIAAASGCLFYYLHADHGVAVLPSFLVAVFVAGPAFGLLMAGFASRLSQQRTSFKVVGTIGVVVAVQGLVFATFGPDPTYIDQFLPFADKSFTVADVVVSGPQVLVAAVSVILVLALAALFRFGRIGTTMRATVQDPGLVDLQGINARAVQQSSWVVGGTLAALSGVLLIPFVGVDAVALTLLIVQAFGAAAFGAFSSLSLTLVGGLVIGVAGSLATKYVVDVPWLAGLPSSVPFVLLLVVLLVLPRRNLMGEADQEARPRLQWRGPLSTRLGAAGVVVAVLAVAPLVVGFRLPYFTQGLVTAILMLSLGFLVRGSGQVSLCHAAFAGVGAVCFHHLAVGSSLPWLVALVGAGLGAAVVGALVALPAIRLSGLYLALATFSFGVMVERLIYPLDFAFGPAANGLSMPRPAFGQGDRAFYFVTLGVLIVVALLVTALHGSRFGRMLSGLGDSEMAVTSMGLSVATTKLVVFAISAFFAGIAGALYGSSVGFSSTSSPFYGSFASLILIAILVVLPFREPWYAVFAAITTVIPSFLTATSTPYWLNVIFGAFAVMVAMQGGTHGMPESWQRAIERWAGRPRRQPEAEVDSASSTTIPWDDEPATDGVPASGAATLELRDVSVRFGGLLAVDGVSLEGRAGEVTGLIGPNGAGKTTLFNAASGYVRPTVGTVWLHGENVTKQDAAGRARRGLGRTFQRIALCESLSVGDNVLLGCESSRAGRSPWSQVVARRSELAELRQRVHEALVLCGIADLAEMQAGSLSTGQRRLVELARCLVGPFDVILLDEPSSGLTMTETETFGRILTRAVRARGLTALLVEHDVELVTRVCSRVYVLDFGKMIFAGNAEEVMDSPQVRAAYLGLEDVVVAGTGGSL